ncbi:hypothetical protein [Actinomycetospora soli]|uniref:hypothetical protein n=1 Tax=Actinomycetospora soli TaxID=2893887 RepID=UPI001E3A15FE|nr:hypothetical protein [Actinomycetospora soli]MCD2191355.1 hypothetical protein [Actinomycetospora soli]
MAAELRALRSHLLDLDSIARESAGLLSETVPKVIDLEESVAALRGTVTALAANAENTPAEDPAVTAEKERYGLRPLPPGPWCWPLFDRDQADAAWKALACWVGELLVPTYGVTRGALPDCWPRHPQMIAELTWLRHAYLEAHQRGAPAVKAQDWHLRGLPGALTAIRDAIPTTGGHASELLCGPGHHLRILEPEETYSYDRRAVIEERAEAPHWAAAWRDVVRDDLQRRRHHDDVTDDVSTTSE